MPRIAEEVLALTSAGKYGSAGVFSSKPTLGLDSIEIVPELNNFAALYQRFL